VGIGEIWNVSASFKIFFLKGLRNVPDIPKDGYRGKNLFWGIDCGGCLHSVGKELRLLIDSVSQNFLFCLSVLIFFYRWV
jgi:hypothetical protein